MSGRRSQDVKAQQYVRQVNQILNDGGNPQELKETLKNWVGMAKVPLEIDQHISVLYFLYTKIIPNDRFADYLARTFGKEIITESEDEVD